MLIKIYTITANPKENQERFLLKKAEPKNPSQKGRAKRYNFVSFSTLIKKEKYSFIIYPFLNSICSATKTTCP